VNVLVDKDKTARLTDFGVTTVLYNSSAAATTLTGSGIGGTVRWSFTKLGPMKEAEQDHLCGAMFTPSPSLYGRCALPLQEPVHG
jgi:hypothetical protein